MHYFNLFLPIATVNVSGANAPLTSEGVTFGRPSMRRFPLLRSLLARPLFAELDDSNNSNMHAIETTIAEGVQPLVRAVSDGFLPRKHDDRVLSSFSSAKTLCRSALPTSEILGFSSMNHIFSWLMLHL